MMSDEERDLLRRVHTACQNERPEILAWLLALPKECLADLEAALDAERVGRERVAFQAALQEFAKVDGAAAASALGTEFNKIVDGAVVVAPAEEVGDAQPL